jgi:hypothetical protein
MAVGIRPADHVAPSNRKKLALTSLISGGRSVGRAHSRTQATELNFAFSVMVCSLWPHTTHDEFGKSSLPVHGTESTVAISVGSIWRTEAMLSVSARHTHVHVTQFQGKPHSGNHSAF